MAQRNGVINLRYRQILRNFNEIKFILSLTEHEQVSTNSVFELYSFV